MTNQEIKLRLVEAFIAQKTPTETIQSEVDKLLDYINKDNPEDVFKIYQVNRESESATEKLIDIEKLNEEKLRKIYFDFYDKMEEPERSEAKENWNYDYAKTWVTPTDIIWAINRGFEWNDMVNYWRNIQKKYS